MKCRRPVRSYCFRMSFSDLVHKHSLNAATAALFGLALWRIGLSPELPAVFAFIFGGMLLATCVGVFFIPLLDVAVQAPVEKLSGKRKKAAAVKRHAKRHQRDVARRRRLY